MLVGILIKLAVYNSVEYTHYETCAIFAHVLSRYTLFISRKSKSTQELPGVFLIDSLSPSQQFFS